MENSIIIISITALSLKPPITMSSSDKKYTHLETKAIMQTRAKFTALGRRWSRLKVISRGKNQAYGLRPEVLTLALDSSRSPSASCDELDARCAFPRFRLSTRNLLLSFHIFATNSHFKLKLFVIEVSSSFAIQFSSKVLGPESGEKTPDSRITLWGCKCTCHASFM